MPFGDAEVDIEAIDDRVPRHVQTYARLQPCNVKLQRAFSTAVLANDVGWASLMLTTRKAS